MKNNIASAAAVRLTLRYPFWAELYYSMTVREAVPGDGIETQATDSRNLWINHAFFSSIPLEQQVAELVHELCHKMFLHCTRRGNRDPKLWNIACDYAINAMMARWGFHIPNDWLLNLRYDGWLAEAIYADLLKKKKQPPQSGQGGGQPYPKHGQVPDDQQPELAPGRDDIRELQGTPEELAKAEDEVKALVDRAIANAKAMGKLPAGIEGPMAKAFETAREPWYNHLHRYMQSLAVAEYNWARVNRRALITHGMMAPLHYAEALGEVALFIDTSGSCYAAAQQAGFAKHLNAILAEAKPRLVRMFYFDAKVYIGDEIMAGEIDVVTRPRGGGGTDFVPIFKALDDEGIVPEVCIILTDLDGRFPTRAPEYPVVWASTLPAEFGAAPFGETIHLTD